MKTQPVMIILAVALVAGCASTPNRGIRGSHAIPPLPAVQLKEIRDLLKDGSFLEALQGVSALRRDAGTLTASDLDPLEAEASTALSAEFKSSLAAKHFDEAYRLLDSAMAMGRADLVAPWTGPSLLQEVASSQEASGDLVPALLTRLRTLKLSGESPPSDLEAALLDAQKLSNRAAVRALIPMLKARGLDVPTDADVLANAPASFPQMLTGTVTILVNRGIKVQNGVGYPDQVIGSGFFIDPRGYLLTNHHVIESEVDPKYEGYSRLYVRLSDSPAGERIPAKVVGYDSIFDLALIKAEVTPQYTFGGYPDPSLAPGDHIYAIGSPAGLEKTITSGIISALGRRFLQVGDTMQVDVPLNPGNSGGPLLSDKGDLLGVVFAGLQQFEGINFAIPYTWVERALPALYRGGEAVHPWMGMALAETDEGLQVIYVMPDEPGQKAGMQVGDTLLAIDGQAYTKIADVQQALLDYDPPSLVRVTYSRGGVKGEALICLSKRPDQPVETALERDARDPVIYPLFGMQLENVGTFLWRGNYIVKSVIKGSIADESGISAEDPLTLQDWQVDKDKGYAAMWIVIKKRKAGFIESPVEIAAYLETNNFV